MKPLINPLARNGKFGWYNTFKKYVTMSTSSTIAKLVLIGDSIIANFDKCSDIFDKFFLPFRTLNFGISKDKIKNVLWRVYNLTLLASIEYVIINCGTNNLGHNSPLKNAKRLIKIACILKKNYKDLHIFVSCLLPRDDEKSIKRSVLYAVNCYLKELCTDQFHYIDLDSGWTLNNHLNTELFRSDNLHLNRKRYEKLSKLLISEIESLQITVRRQNLKSSRNYTEAVSFSRVDDQFPPLVNLYIVLMFVNLSSLFTLVNIYVLLTLVNIYVLLALVNLYVRLILVTLCVLLIVLDCMSC